MNQEDILKYSQIPQPAHEDLEFIRDLARPEELCFNNRPGCPPDADSPDLSGGVEFDIQFPAGNIETAYASLRRILGAKGIEEKTGGISVRFIREAELAREEYRLKIGRNSIELAAADEDGMRRAVYYFEDKLRETAGKSAPSGEWRRKAYVRHRISRCFFGPTYRAPFFIDELNNEIDYYPEEYLNKLAHEGVNGLWLSMYFRDLKSSLFPGRGEQMEKRFAKLRTTAARCARYGIRIYVYICEPKMWGRSDFAISAEDAKDHAELIGCDTFSNLKCFCTSNETAKQYFAESLTQLFTAVPELGGIINIMFGEDNGSCVNYMMYPNTTCNCPRCSKRTPGEIFGEIARVMSDAMHKVSPKAEYIAWFYAPGIRDGSVLAQRLDDAVKNWPDHCSLMFNFESGGVSMQLDKGRNVYDYSLAYIGPSELFRTTAARTARPAAKLQVGCSHEDASVPFIPVPGNLYEKYKIIHELGVGAVMQCWYFGNYPGLMNKAAGELSFDPFPQSEDEFLRALARPIWGEDTPLVVRAWKYFAEGYRQFPANIAFAWYGPLHQSISWPLHLFPADAPISPSWLLKNFPEVSGDRIGECLIYQHTLPEALELCRRMLDSWQKGMAIFSSLSERYKNDPERRADIDLAEAILLQISSTYNILQFYSLREDMLFNRRNHLEPMKKIVHGEIRNSHRMSELCERDSRLGYHSEAEGYLFFPAKLKARVKLLEQLLNDDFPEFDLNAPWIDEYTGRKITGPVAFCRSEPGDALAVDPEIKWQTHHDGKMLYLHLQGKLDKYLKIEIEACRMWPPFVLMLRENGCRDLYQIIFREVPEVTYEGTGDRLTIGIPLKIFDGYRREGYPMRINLSTNDGAWVKRDPWPHRLLQEDYNPACAGWLVLGE